MGKVGGEPPRPVRWRSGAAQLESLLPLPHADVLTTCQAQELLATADVQGDATADGSQEPAAMAFTSKDENVEEDPLMFTAQPSSGFVLKSDVFEKLQKGVSHRYAIHRYAEGAE